MSWLIDDSGFYYTRYPAPGTVPAGQEPYHRQIFLHRLSDDPDNDVDVFGAGQPMEAWPDTDFIQALVAIPGAALALGASYLWGSRLDVAHGLDHGHTREGSV